MESSRVACLEGVKGLVKLARDMAKSAGAPQLYKKLNSAIKSADGAIRNAQLDAYRRQRR